LRAPLPPLYPIIDVEVCASRDLDPVALARAYVAGGARLLQLRQKAGGSGEFLRLIRAVHGVASEAGAALVVNDRADLAAMAGAEGVHVGQEDLSVADVRAVVGAHTIVGLSTHTPEQVSAALTEDADYVAVGPIFGTATKDTGYSARGLDLLRQASGRGKPIVAIGGITLESAAAVIEAGAASVAVISDLLSTGNPEARVRAYLRALA
jgi:thiamine-phosphate pyrophosphorylase